MASNYLLMIMALVPAWQPQSPIKHLPKLEAGLLIGKKQIQSRLHLLPRQIYQRGHASIHRIHLLSHPHLAFLSVFCTAASTALEQDR